MIRKIFRKKKKRNNNFFVEPDEIFLDSKNLLNFNLQQFEGRIEKPIPKKTVLFIGVFFLLTTLSFLIRLGYLQIGKGEAYYERSQNNTLAREIIFADRGIIYDRNRTELAWNKKEGEFPNGIEQANTSSTRAYLTPGFSHTLGYVSYPSTDKTGVYWQTDFIGKDGLEKEYNDNLKGMNGLKIIETDAEGRIHSENMINAPVRGADLVTTIDSRIQKELFSLIETTTQNNMFAGGTGILIDIKNGEIVSSTSFPEYNSEILSLGKDKGVIKEYLSDTRKVFLDRTISGLYAPGSIVKPFVAIGALAEGVIDPNKKILSTGSISLPNPFFPGQESVFKDWKAHGWVDMRQALAVSSDVYFYEIGGGYKDQKGMGISNIEKYVRLFGIGSKTDVDLPDEKSGIIPNPEWKIKNFKGDPWRIGNTYHTAIGQYGFQVTPIEMARSIGAIANYGTLVTPHFILGDVEKEKNVSKIDLPREYYDIVHEGMRQGVTFGTSSILDVPYVKVASKTGTAQLGVNRDKVNSWVTGFFPYENPRYVYVIMMEAGPANGTVGAVSVMRRLLDWMSIYTPEYFK